MIDAGLWFFGVNARRGAACEGLVALAIVGDNWLGSAPGV
jgi:hypothetical protein